MRRVRSSLMAVLTVIATVAGVTAAVGPVGTTTVLRDSLGDAVRSDGYVPSDYIHGTDCVASTRDARSGATALRTASHTVCADSDWQNGLAAIRKINLDFSNPVWGVFPNPCQIADLNACGPNTIPDVRIETTDAFSSQALSRGTGMNIYVSFHPALNNTEFYIEYRATGERQRHIGHSHPHGWTNRDRGALPGNARKKQARVHERRPVLHADADDDFDEPAMKRRPDAGCIGPLRYTCRSRSKNER